MASRRAVLLGLGGLVAALPAAAAPKTVLRVVGAVSPRNFSGLRAFLLNSQGRVVGLRIRFRERADGPDGSLIAGISVGAFDGDLAGGDLNIHAERGFSAEHGTIGFDGFFRVEYGGMHQGITGLALAPVSAASVTGPVKDIDIGRLRADLAG
jgi:hypothetical protein